MGFITLHPWSDWLVYLGIIINIYIYYPCMLFYFYSGLSQRFQRPFLPCAIITGFVLPCFPLFPLSPLSSLSLLCLEIQYKVHYENFISCYVCNLMSKSIRPALCVTEQVLQILLWGSWYVDSQICPQTYSFSAYFWAANFKIFFSKIFSKRNLKV